MAEVFTDMDDKAPAPDGGDDDDRRRTELASQMQAVRRRSRLIQRLRRFLPAGIVLTLLISIGWIAGQSIVNSLNVYQANADEIRMTNPRFVGQTGDGQPYTISGLEAVRRGRNATTIDLKSPNIEIKGKADRPTIVTADKGVYDQNTQKFILTGHVVLGAGGSDFTLKTEEATVDLTNSSIYGDKHVEGSGSMGHIVGESFVVRDEGRNMSIKGRGDTKVTATFEETPAANTPDAQTNGQ